MKRQNPSTKSAIPAAIILKISEVGEDPRFQPRADFNEEVVTEYALAYQAVSPPLPPIVVYRIGDQTVCVDGRHRLAGARKAGLDKISAIVLVGSENDAFEAALRANCTHGLRRTNRDKRRYVEIALREFGDRTDPLLAEMCSVSAEFVRKRRAELPPTVGSSERIGRNKKRYKPKPANPASDTNSPDATGRKMVEKYCFRLRRLAEEMQATLPPQFKAFAVAQIKSILWDLQSVRDCQPAVTPSNNVSNEATKTHS